MPNQLCTVWQIQDGKPGHVNQMRGLTASLADRWQVEIHEIMAPSRPSSWWGLLTGSFPPGSKLPAPDLILGAGHATHLAVLAARRAYGGRAVVLMRPTLPCALFDLCLVPQHDGVAESSRVVSTCGVLNSIRPAGQHDLQHGLFLIGGPSAEYGWDDDEMVQQIGTIAAASNSVSWKLTSSRRTPATFLHKLKSEGMSRLTIVPHDETSPGWVPEQLACAGQVWVSADSVSMLYESLTSGAAVGVLDVPARRQGRVTVGMNEVLDKGWATRYADWQQKRDLLPAVVQLDEAGRCAEIITERLLGKQAA